MVTVVVALVLVVAPSAATAATAPTSDAQSPVLCSTAVSHNSSTGRSDRHGNHRPPRARHSCDIYSENSWN